MKSFSPARPAFTYFSHIESYHTLFLSSLIANETTHMHMVNDCWAWLVSFHVDSNVPTWGLLCHVFYILHLTFVVMNRRSATIFNFSVLFKWTTPSRDHQYHNYSLFVVFLCDLAIIWQRSSDRNVVKCDICYLCYAKLSKSILFKSIIVMNL